ncbi:hypothetical protein HHI36_013344 [Cryptolaemus montrouzieri]|uniref:Uncharacterized protein n=1 Tax=Cryptolaemus montrouzieri TaxID=559131 RepID=A0ABD2NH17_9CUCU
MFDLFAFVKNKINSYINYYYVIISMVNKLYACLSKIEINVKDIFTPPPDPFADAKKNFEKLQEQNEANLKQAQENMKNLFKPLPPLPPLPPLKPLQLPKL